MGFFDSKWIVEFEYSEGFLSSFKRVTMVVNASSEYSAMRTAKSVLSNQFKYTKVLSARKSTGKADEKSVSFSPIVSIEPKKAVQTTYVEPQIKEEEEEETEEVKKQRRELVKRKEELYKQIQEKEAIQKQGKKVKRIYKSVQTAIVLSILFSLLAFLFGWIPYWFWDRKRSQSEWAIQQMYEFGHDDNNKYVQEFYADRAHEIEMRDSVLWIPFVVLAVGIIVSFVLIVVVRKRKEQLLSKEVEKLNSMMSTK